MDLNFTIEHNSPRRTNISVEIDGVNSGSLWMESVDAMILITELEKLSDSDSLINFKATHRRAENGSGEFDERTTG